VLLGCGEAAQVHLLATAPHLRLIGLGLAGLAEVHAEVARLAIGHEQRQPLRMHSHVTQSVTLSVTLVW
jgi:hypothetical protein